MYSCLSPQFRIKGERERLAFWIKRKKVSLGNYLYAYLCCLSNDKQLRSECHFLLFFSFFSLSLFLCTFSCYTFPYEPNSVGVEWGEFKWNALKLISHSLSFMPIYFVNVCKCKCKWNWNLNAYISLLRMITVPTSSTTYPLFVGFRGSRSSGRNSCLHFAPTIQHHGQPVWITWDICKEEAFKLAGLWESLHPSSW